MPLWVECSPMAQETGVQAPVESYQRLKKCYLILLYLTLSIIRYVSRVKWSNPGEGVALSLTPQCSSYWKESFWVAPDYGCQLYLLLQIFKTTILSVDTALLSHGEKILFKQSNGLISVIRTLLYEKQWLRGGMLTLNVVVQTQVMLNTQGVQIRRFSQKTPQNRFGQS